MAKRDKKSHKIHTENRKAVGYLGGKQERSMFSEVEAARRRRIAQDPGFQSDVYREGQPNPYLKRNKPKKKCTVM